MSRKNKFSVFVALLVTLILVLGAWAPALAQDFTNSDGLGNLGIYSPTLFDTEVMNAERVSWRSAGGAPVFWARDLIRFNFDGDGVMPLTYVWADLHPWEARAFMDGNLQLYHQPEGANTWQTCNSFQVGQTEEGSFEGFRIACVSTGPGLYGIGATNKSAVPILIPGK